VEAEMRNSRIEKQNKWNTLAVLILAGCFILALLSGRLMAQSRISVDLEALPSEDCFPTSALQIADVQDDFSKICPECNLKDNPDQITDFRLVVEDPSLSWLLSIYDNQGKLVQVFKWSGALDVGLKKAAKFMRVQHSNQSTMTLASK
jgi:hypothetical protein